MFVLIIIVFLKEEVEKKEERMCMLGQYLCAVVIFLKDIPFHFIYQMSP